VALLICCSTRYTAQVDDLYPASSNSSVRLVSLQMVTISAQACSWPSQHSCFFRKFYPPLVIVHPRSGSRHVARPSVVISRVSFTCSFHTCEKSKILTKPTAGIFWSRNKSFPISSDVSCSRRRRGSYAVVGIEGASHRMLLCMNSENFTSIGLLTMSGWCVELCLEGSIFLLYSKCSSVSVRSILLLQYTRFSSKIKSVIQAQVILK